MVFISYWCRKAGRCTFFYKDENDIDDDEKGEREKQTKSLKKLKIFAMVYKTEIGIGNKQLPYNKELDMRERSEWIMPIILEK